MSGSQETPSATAPGPEEPAFPDPSWTALERWVWRKLQAGTVANIDEYEAGGSRLPPADPGKPEDWQDGLRRLTPSFLEDLLLREPYRSKLHHKGVRIEGAWFDEGIDLEWPEVTGQIRLERCRFEQPIRFTDMRTPRSVSFDGSAFADDLQLRLFHIGGEVSLIGAKVAGRLRMVSADIGKSLFMDSLPAHQAEFHDVDLYGAKVGGDVSLLGAKVAGTLSMISADIGQSLFMDSLPEHQAEFNGEVSVVLDAAKVGGDVSLMGAKAAGQVSLVGAKVAGRLAMISADIGKSLLMNADLSDESQQQAVFDGDVSLIFAEIGINLDVRGAVLSSLDLTGTKIGGELRLASSSSLPRWQKGARLVLRDASVDVIQDVAEEGVWPPNLELDGFTYRRFSGLANGAETGVARRRSKWFTKTWLARDKAYTPQPYQRCAQMLREVGHPEMANDVLYAGRERERKEAWRTGNRLRGTGLILLKWFVGHGYGQRLLWRPLAWVVALVAAGTMVLHLTGVPNELAGSEANVVAYSLDTLLPIVQLEKSHADIPLNGIAKYYFHFQKLMGWALASFLIAGLSGLTK